MPRFFFLRRCVNCEQTNKVSSYSCKRKSDSISKKTECLRVSGSAQTLVKIDAAMSCWHFESELHQLIANLTANSKQTSQLWDSPQHLTLLGVHPKSRSCSHAVSHFTLHMCARRKACIWLLIHAASAAASLLDRV